MYNLFCLYRVCLSSVCFLFTVFDGFESMGVLDNTYVIFSSDNGTQKTPLYSLILLVLANGPFHDRPVPVLASARHFITWYELVFARMVDQRFHANSVSSLCSFVAPTCNRLPPGRAQANLRQGPAVRAFSPSANVHPWAGCAAGSHLEAADDTPRHHRGTCSTRKHPSPVPRDVSWQFFSWFCPEPVLAYRLNFHE